MHKLSSHLISDNNENDDSCRTNCIFDHYPVSLPSTSNKQYEFISSKWVSCTADYGGGIYLTAGTTVSLFVTKGEFYSCKAAPYRGGGIYVGRIGKLEVTTSLFSGCVAEAKADCGGGGIDLNGAQAFPYIKCSSFISCTSGNDGGGLAIWSSPSFQKICLTDSRFVGCKGLANPGTDGGSLIVWASEAAIGSSNTLFVDSHSEWSGGAASYNITRSHNSTIPLFSFCFFKNNSARYNPGNDVFFAEWSPTQPFHHCFSLTATNRVYDNKNSATHNNDCLPQCCK